MAIHLSDQDVEGFVADRLSAVDFKSAVRHLLGCAACRTQLAPWAEILTAEDSYEPPEAPALALAPRLDQAVDRACAAARRRLFPRWRKLRTRRNAALAAWQGQPEVVARLCTDNPSEVRRLRGWPLLEVLLAASFEARYRDPELMGRLAFQATMVARHLKPAEYGETLVKDLQARAWAEYANALRVNDELEEADETLARAVVCWQEGTGDLHLQARLSDIGGSLRGHQRRLDAALSMVDRALRIYRQLGEHHLAGRALINRGFFQWCDAQYQEAAESYREGLALLEPGRDPHLEAAALNNLADACAGAGDFRAAGALLLSSDLRRKFADEPLSLLRLRWVEGKVAAGVGNLDAAERALQTVHEEFLDRDLHYDAALVGLDLAAVWLRQGNHEAVVTLADEMLATFTRLGIHREAVKALEYLVEACEAEEASVAEIVGVRDFLARLEWRPGLRFQAA